MFRQFIPLGAASSRWVKWLDRGASGMATSSISSIFQHAEPESTRLLGELGADEVWLPSWLISQTDLYLSFAATLHHTTSALKRQ